MSLSLIVLFLGGVLALGALAVVIAMVVSQRTKH